MKFLYLANDPEKKPVKLEEQKPGTKLMLVTHSGDEYRVVAGQLFLKKEMTKETKDKLEEIKKDLFKLFKPKQK